MMEEADIYDFFSRGLAYGVEKRESLAGEFPSDYRCVGDEGRLF